MFNLHLFNLPEKSDDRQRQYTATESHRWLYMLVNDYFDWLQALSLRSQGRYLSQ